MIYLWIIYCLLLILGILGVSLTQTHALTDLLIPLLLLPLLPTLYQDFKHALRRRRRLKFPLQFASSATIPTLPQLKATTSDQIEAGEAIDPTISDSNRRLFLRLIGSSGLAVFFMAVMGKGTAQATFFGSVPGPGTVSVKDSSGTTIDPAEKQPTDGYEITEVDDVSSPSYYGFLHKTGAWYITKETSAGAYRYAKGSADFATNWTGRTGLTYDYFDNVF